MIRAMSLKLTDLATWWKNRELRALGGRLREAPAVPVPMGVRR